MGRRVWLLLVHRSPLPKTCQAVGQDICHFDSLGVLSPNFIHVFSNFGLSHIRSISRVRHAAELSFESRRLSFLIRIKPLFNMHTIQACAFIHHIGMSSSSCQMLCRQVRMRQDHLVYQQRPGDKPNSQTVQITI
jgi:hypothetical protein